MKNKIKNKMTKGVAITLCTATLGLSIPYTLNSIKPKDSVSTTNNVNEFNPEEFKGTLFYKYLTRKIGKQGHVQADDVYSLYTKVNISFDIDEPYDGSRHLGINSASATEWKEALKDLHSFMSTKSNLRINIVINYGTHLDEDSRLITDCISETYEIRNTIKQNTLAIEYTKDIDVDLWNYEYSIFNTDSEIFTEISRDEYTRLVCSK